ncbi:unnamed protein product [Parnassius apollo]|uniref:(apollo) hypothetical protein n=1 Tax=Parnassius apollo TaxID=110799 RepID=A0A8S3XRR0_PARAO|nr:unnamed protein product [Parnassius apollo]
MPQIAGAGYPVSMHAQPPHAYMSGPPPMPMQVRQHQMPVVVMPYRSKATDRVFKRKKPRRPEYYSDQSSCESSSTSDADYSSSSEFQFRGSRGSKKRWLKKKKKRNVLTPVISYVTRSGRVVYQKKIKKENPSDWLQMGRRKIPFDLQQNSRQVDTGSAEITVRDLKKQFRLKKYRHRH